MDGIRFDGLDELVRQFGTDLTPAQQAVGVALAKEAENRIAPYPQQPPPRSPRSRYVRGTGTVYVSGRVRKTSETLGRRWNVRRMGAGAQLENSASYSGWVHRRDMQTKQHQQTGWNTDEGVVSAMEADGVIEQIAADAVTKTLGFK